MAQSPPPNRQIDQHMPATFQIHWGVVPPDEAAGLVSERARLLAIWPAPVNLDLCFQAAGFTLFGDADEDWDRAAEGLLHRVIARLGRFGGVRLSSKPLHDSPPWYLRPFRVGRELTLHEQALLPMQWDLLPAFHARFGDDGAALRTGDGHFLLWIDLPGDGTEACAFIREVAGPWPICETRLRWQTLLPGGKAPVRAVS